LISDPAIEQLILKDFRLALATELDRTAITGTGTGNQPRGIINTPGIGSIALGTNGGPPTWESIVGLEREVAADNADSGSLGYVTSALGRSKLKTVLKSAVAGADYIWADDPKMQGMGRLNGCRAMASTTVPSNLTKGTGTNLSAIVYGDWSSLIIATWGVLSLEVDPYADFRKGRIATRVLLFADMAVRHAQSFAAITDMSTT
jgi:HK97 family phage major capsid protein